jgi:hypothetical protein
MVLLLQCIAVQSASRKKVNLAAATGAVTDDYESLITCDACLDDGLGWDPETRTCGHYPALPCPGGCANLRADSAAGRACDGGGLTSAHEVEDDDMEARIEAASRQHEDTPTSSRLWELISGNHVEDLVAWVEEEVRERRRGKQEIGQEPRSTLIPSRPNQFSAHASTESSLAAATALPSPAVRRACALGRRAGPTVLGARIWSRRDQALPGEARCRSGGARFEGQHPEDVKEVKALARQKGRTMRRGTSGHAPGTASGTVGDCRSGYGAHAYVRASDVIVCAALLS